MVEESNLSEQNLDVESIDLNQESGISSDLSFMNSSDDVLYAKPEAIDIYKNSVGNPVTGSNPAAKASGVSNVDAINNIVNNSVKKSQTSVNPYARMKPFTYSGDYDGANFQRYYSTKAYDTLGFSPYRDNESLYNQNMTLGDDFVRAASQWDNLVVTGFKSGIKAWGTLFTDPLAPDMESAREMERAMAIGSSGKGGLGGFAVNTFLNSAYTIGIAADFLGEEMALAAATAFTGGLAGEVTIPGMAAKAGMAARRFAGLGEAGAKIAKNAEKAKAMAEASKTAGQISGSVDEVFDGVNGARSFFNKTMSGAFDILNPLENTVNAFRKTDYATDLAKTIGRSGAFIDDIIHIKTAVSEAKLEGGMVKINATKSLIDQYRSMNDGADPEGKDLENIEKLASDEARRTAFWNLPAIMTSNKLLYSTMMLPIAKMVGKTGSRTVRLIENIAAEKGMKALVTDPFKVVGRSAGAQLKAAAKSFKNPKLYGTYGMTYLKANFAEGIQENIQEAISSGAIQNALATQRDPRMASYQGYMGHFMKGLEEQISAQGFETFAGGFAMGMFVQPVMSAPAWSAAKLSEVFKNKEKIKDAKDARDAALGAQTEVLNDLANRDVLLWAPDLGTAIKNGSLSDDLTHAASIGDHSSAKSAKDTITFNHIGTAISTGKFDLLMDKLADYKNLTPSEALEAFKKYDIGINTEEDAVKALGYFDKVIERAHQIKNEYENVAENFPNPHDYTKYKANSPEYIASKISYNAWEEAQKNLIYANSTFKSYGNRIKNMASSFSDLATEIAQSEAQSLMSVLSLSNLQKELLTLKSEIRTLGEVPEQASVKKEKEKTLNLLENFYESIKEAQETIAKDPTMSYLDKQLIYSQAKKDFQKYLQYLSKKNDNVLFNNTADKAFSLLTDTLEMKNDMQGLARSINVLSDPTGFFNLQTRIVKALTEDRLNRYDNITKNLEKFMTMKDEAVILQELGKEGLKLPEDFLEVYKKALENGETLPEPEYFIDPETDKQINPSTDPEKYTTAADLWLTFAQWMEMNSKVKPKEEAKEEKPIEFDDKDFSTFPEDLKADLQELYEDYKQKGLLQEGQTIEEFVKDNIVALTKIELAKTGATAKKKAETEAKKTQSFEEYKNLSISELNARLKEVLKAEVTDPSMAPERKKIQDALRYKVRAELKLTDKQQKALDEIEKLKKVVKNKDNEKNPYIVEGDRKDLRVTQLVDVILEKEFPGYRKFYYAYTKEGSPSDLLALYNNLAADELLKNNDPAIHAKNVMAEFKKQAAGLQDFEKRFNDRKLNAMEKRLAKAPMTEKQFADLLDEYVYEETSIRGNTLDKFGRDYFEGVEMKPENYNMTEKAFEQARQIFIKFDTALADKGEVILSNGLIVWGTSEYNVDGKPQTVGGEMDLLVVTPNGEYKIYDMKTANNWANFGVDKVTETGEVEKEEYHKKDRYSLQLGIYKNATENLTSVPVTGLNLLPLQTKQDLDGRITSVFEADAVKNKVIDYNEIKPILDKYLPSKLEQKPEDLLKPKTPTTDTKADNIISNGDRIINVQTKSVTDEITDTNGELFITSDKDPGGRIYINMDPLKDVLVVPNNTLIVIDKKTGKEIINKELNPEGAVVFEAMQGRLFVVANINGQLIPFYKSSAGTSGKTQGEWYPFFGYTGAWLVKGGIDKATGKMNYSPEIDKVTTLLNENLVFPDKYIDRTTNTIKGNDGVVIMDMNKAFKVNRLWQKEFGSQTGKGTNYEIKGLKENTRSESGLVALITGLNTTELDSAKTPKENSEWFNLISKNAELAALESKPAEEIKPEDEEVEEVEVVETKPAPISAKDIIEDTPATDEIDEAVKANKRSQVQYGDMFSVGRRKARFNSKEQRWEFFDTKGRLITNNVLIKQLSETLAKSRGIVNAWWTTLLSNKERDSVLGYFNDLYDLYMRGQYMSKQDFSTTPEVLTLDLLIRMKFKIGGDVDKNTTDVDRKVWFSEDGSRVDTFVTDTLMPHLESYGALDSSKDEQDYVHIIYDLVDQHPNGVKSKHIKAYIKDTNPNKKLYDLNDTFINRYGLNIEVVFNKLHELKKLDYEKSINSNITNNGLTGGEEDLGEFEDLEERDRDEEAVKKQINDAYKGALVFLSPGTGKTTFSTTFSDVIDADVLTLSAIRELSPDFDLKGYDTVGKAVYDYTVHYSSPSGQRADKKALYELVYQKAQVYMNMGKTVVTGSSNLMQYADYVFIQQNKAINDVRAQQRYDVSKELVKVNELNKPYILINEYADTVLKKSPEELKAKTPEGFKNTNKETDTEQDTPEELSKKINIESLTTAMQKGYNIIYKNKAYVVSKIEENIVSLTNLQGETITVNPADITSIEDSKSLKTEGEETDTVKGNSDAIKNEGITLTPGINKNDALNNIKKKKC